MLNTLTIAVNCLKVYRTGKLGNPLINISCQITSLLLFVFCAIVTSQQYFGEPIQCLADVTNDNYPIPEKIMNLYCFISATYSRVETTGNGRLTQFLHDRTQHSYYPWVPLFIFLQGMLFMVPPSFGTIKEHSYLEKYIIDSKSLEKKDLDTMASYLSKRLDSYGGWTLSCLFSELIFCLTILGNFVITDKFLGGRFLEYGYMALLNWQHYGETIFPKMTKCNFHKYGPSGTIELYDALCLMTLNIINEKLYLLLWYWLVLLLALSLLIIVRRIFYLAMLLFRSKCSICTKMALAPNISRSGFIVLIKKLSISDWLLLEQIKPHVDTKSYSKVLEKIAKQISEPNDLILSRDNFDLA